MEKKVDYLQKVKEDSREMFEKSVKEIASSLAKEEKQKQKARPKATKGKSGDKKV